MDPNPVVMSIPQPASWFMNPFFMASFGAVVALGFVLFALAYFVFVKLKFGQKTEAAQPEECKSCGLTSEQISKFMPCKDHGALSIRVGFMEKWQETHGEDYKELRRRVDAIERIRKSE